MLDILRVRWPHASGVAPRARVPRPRVVRERHAIGHQRQDAGEERGEERGEGGGSAGHSSRWTGRAGIAFWAG